MKKYFIACFILLISSATLLLGRTFRGVSMAPNSLQGWVVASDTWGYVLHTPDGGLHWYSQSFVTSRAFTDIFSLNEQKSWICGVEGFVFYTPNGGQNWYRQAMGIGCCAFRICFINDTCGWVSSQMAIIGRSTIGNDTIFNWQNWQSILLPYPHFHQDSCDIQNMSFINHMVGWLCAGVKNRFFCPGNTLPGGQGYIAVSNDSGLNWQLLLRDSINDFFDIRMLDSLNGFVIGGNDQTMSGTVMKTENGGLSWQSLTLPSQAKYLRSMKIIGSKIWAVGHHGTILYSNDLGNNWILQNCPIDTTLYDIDFGDTLHGLIGAEGNILYTHNGGNTWNIANLGLEEEITASSVRNDFVVYPNPAKSYLTIHCPFSIIGIKIFDVTGKLIKEIATPSARNNYISRILLNEIKNGIYFIRAETQSGPIIKRLVIIK